MESIYHLDEIYSVIDSLKTQTEHGKLQWDCDYMPPHFYAIVKDEYDDILFEDDDERLPTLQHGGEFTIELGQRRYELTFFEGFYLELQNERFSYLDLKIYNQDGEMLTTHQETVETDEQDTHGIEAFCHALFSNTEKWFEPSMFDYKDDENYFFNHSDVTEEFKNQPLAKVAWKLSQERRVEDFHRFIIDSEYRQQLLNI